jgi:hypothetical protein
MDRRSALPPQHHAPRTPPEQRSRTAWLDVRRGRIWTGARVPGEVTVGEGELRFTITERRHERKERLAISRWGGERALAQLLARDPLVISFPLGEVSLRFPKIPLLGRTLIRVRREGDPDMIITFLEAGASGASPYALMLGVLSRGSGARRERDAVRREIEGVPDELARGRG